MKLGATVIYVDGVPEIPAFDARMLLCAAVVTTITAVGFGMLPALRAGRLDASALAEGARTGPGHGTERLRKVLVVAESQRVGRPADLRGPPDPRLVGGAAWPSAWCSRSRLRGRSFPRLAPCGSTRSRPFEPNKLSRNFLAACRVKR